MTVGMARRQDIEATAEFGERVDFGKTASDYRAFRAGFPEAFFARLAQQIGLRSGQAALDIGTGTGTVARGLASLGMNVAATDPASALLREAAELDCLAGVSVDYREGRAEGLDFADGSFDLVTAGQCWHWFDRDRAAAEAFRVLNPGGTLVIAHFDWLPLRGNVVEATERLIVEVNPALTMGGGTGLYPQWLADMADAGFVELETRSFDIAQPYSHEAWCGRVRASAGVRGSLDEVAADRFAARLRALLGTSFSRDPLEVPHRVWWASGRRPTSARP
jgi:SAM-dependent methyltransferase